MSRPLSPSPLCTVSVTGGSRKVRGGGLRPVRLLLLFILNCLCPSASSARSWYTHLHQAVGPMRTGWAVSVITLGESFQDSDLCLATHQHLRRWNNKFVSKVTLFLAWIQIIWRVPPSLHNVHTQKRRLNRMKSAGREHRLPGPVSLGSSILIPPLPALSPQFWQPDFSCISSRP